jgi:hypothetical protein
MEVCMLRPLILRLRAYATNPDPLAAAANTIALVVAGNQPFYPLYLHAIAGTAAWPAWLTLLTTPFFAAIPAVTRRHSLAGRAMLPVVGVANTMLAAKLFGVASAVELFLLPCVLLAALLFRPRERAIMVPVLALPLLAYSVLDPMLGAPMRMFGAEVSRSIAKVNALSVAGLTAFIGLLFAGILADRDS